MRKGIITVSCAKRIQNLEFYHNQGKETVKKAIPKKREKKKGFVLHFLEFTWLIVETMLPKSLKEEEDAEGRKDQ